MGVSFSKRDKIIGRFPNNFAKIEGNNAIRSGVDLAPHAEKGGSLAPNRGMLASLQGSPQDLMCGDQGIAHVLHVTLLRRCETMETQGGDREKTQHHEMRSTHPYSFLEVDAPEEVTGVQTCALPIYSCSICAIVEEV